MLTDDEQKAAAAPPLQIPVAAPAPVYAQPVQQAPVPAPVAAPAPVPAAAPVSPVPVAAPVEYVPVQPVQPAAEHHDAQ